MLRILEGLQREIARVDRKVDAIDEKLEVGFAAMLRQNDRRFLDHEGRLRVLEKGK